MGRITAKELRNKPMTEEQLARLKELETSEPEPDEELPELTFEQMQEFKTLAELRQSEHKTDDSNQIVAVQLSPQAYSKAKSLGNGYTGILSRIIENALNDPDFLRNCL